MTSETGNYSNRELDHFFGDIKSSLKRIEEQVTKTNGRVSSLEKWRWMVVGGLMVLSAIVLPIVVSSYKINGQTTVAKQLPAK